MKSYEEIKEILLKDENIYEVDLDTHKKRIFIKPVQNKSFGYIEQPLEEYDEGDYLEIGERCFEVYDYKHFNTTIYNITLKEI